MWSIFDQNVVMWCMTVTGLKLNMALFFLYWDSCSAHLKPQSFGFKTKHIWTKAGLLGNKTAGIHVGHLVPRNVDKEGPWPTNSTCRSSHNWQCRFHTLSHNYDRKRGLGENACGTMTGEGGMVPNGSFGTLLLGADENQLPHCVCDGRY